MAQTPLPVVVSGRELPTHDIGQFTEFYEDKSGDTLPLGIIQKQHFLPFAQKRNERTTNADQSLLVTWLRFRIRNTNPTDTLRLFYDCWQGAVINYYENNHLLAVGGHAVPRRNGSPNTSSVLLKIPAGQTYTYYVQTISYIMGVLPTVSFIHTPEEAYKNTLENAYLEAPLLVSMAILTGCLLFMSLFAFYYFWLTRDKAYLYYNLYTFTGFYFAVSAIDTRFGLNILYLSTWAISPISLSLFTLFYALFLEQLLSIRQRFPSIWPFLCVLLLILAIQQLMSLIESIQGKLFFSNNTIYRYNLVPPVLTTLILLGVLIRSQAPIKKYLLAGIVSLICISFLPLMLNGFFQNVPPRIEIFVNYPGFWGILGISIESLCFALALAYRGRLVELENTSLHASYTRQLEDKLAQRTQEIQEQSRQLEEQHIRQLELGFEQKLAETEMTALRAQMNPHFIFNCLNSIKLYATENDAAKASDYLTKFSRLIRLVLENSRSERVTLKNELDALQLYLTMEAMRFKAKLNFRIDIDPAIDAEFIEIPPLLLQPYVENAIWHGLMHKESGGRVLVQVAQPQDNGLRVTITDDGIGRAEAASLKSKSAMPKKSFGMKVTGERIALINQLYKTSTHVQIRDLVDSEGQPAGTEVVLEIRI